MQAISKLSCCAILFSLSQLSLANNSHTTNESDLITIPPHSRSAAVNAKHAQECAEMGGVDISDKHEMKIGHGVTDSLACEITDKKRYEAYLAAKHQNNLKQTCDTHEYDRNKPEYGSYTLCRNAHDYVFYGYPFEYGAEYYLSNDSNKYVLDAGLFSYIEKDAPRCSQTIDIKLEGKVSKTINTQVECNLDSSYATYYGLKDYIARSYNSNRSYDHETDDIGHIQIEYPYDRYNGKVSIPQNLGQPLYNRMCTMPSSQFGNPIDFTIGNKFQQEVDYTGRGAYPLQFIRYYNSQDNGGKWRHSYSMRLDISVYPNYANRVFRLTHDDGREEVFIESQGTISSKRLGYGTMKRTGVNEYEYTTIFNERYYFDTSGFLLKTISDGGLVHNFTHPNNREVVVTDSFGQSMTIYDNGNFEPEKVKLPNGKTINFEYDARQRLAKMIKNGKTRTYHYEDASFPRALTGITDENGIRYVTWGYDANGIAVSSEYAGGVYNYKRENSRQLKTPLSTVGVDYSNIAGHNFVTKEGVIDKYTYTETGNVSSKIGYDGIITGYDYNDKGQETTRTIAKGRAEQAIISTTWDDSFNKPKTVTYPDKVITYTYDNDGNVTSKTIKSLN